jgi:hypothetical protein
MGVLLRSAGVGVVGGGDDSIRSENDLLLLVRRSDFPLRSADSTPETDLPFLTSRDSSGLFSTIVPRELVPGVRARFGDGVVMRSFFSLGSPNID